MASKTLLVLALACGAQLQTVAANDVVQARAGDEPAMAPQRRRLPHYPSWTPYAVQELNEYWHECVGEVGGVGKGTFATYDALSLTKGQQDLVDEFFNTSAPSDYACKQGCLDPYVCKKRGRGIMSAAPADTPTVAPTPSSQGLPTAPHYPTYGGGWGVKDPDNDYEYDCQGEGHLSGRVFAVYDEKTLTPKQHAMAVKLYGSAPDQYACKQAAAAWDCNCVPNGPGIMSSVMPYDHDDKEVGFAPAKMPNDKQPVSAPKASPHLPTDAGHKVEAGFPYYETLTCGEKGQFHAYGSLAEAAEALDEDELVEVASKKLGRARLLGKVSANATGEELIGMARKKLGSRAKVFEVANKFV